MRGEHCPSRQGRPVRRGSSPHARGTQRHEERKQPQVGIIPACAGNTKSLCRKQARQQDHPRMRGEHVEYGHRQNVGQGSSPHARGTRPYRNGTDKVVGIIPACAGNTPSSGNARGLPRDHPRMRGEHDYRVHARIRGQGSSPHARGTLPHRLELERERGIIPACAGNTPCHRRTRDSSRDHPRMRGEHAKRHNPYCWEVGSSPHARGTLLGNIISDMRVWDHPRMRGEHSPDASEMTVEEGSSPHARGTPG